MKHATILTAAVLLSSAAAAAQSSGPFTVAETGNSHSNLQAAVYEAEALPTGTILIAPGVHRNCAVQQRGSVTFRAAQPGEARFSGIACEGKAALVLRGQSSRIEGLVFSNIRVGDGNGAGIRLETGDLFVSQSWFRDSQQGILTANDANGDIVIDKSTFSRLGTCENSAGCAHSIYIGDYGSLTVTRSRFEEGRGGHYVKSRAARIDLRDSSFDDARGQATNYMVDLPAGAVGRIANNWFVQGSNKENWSAFIAVAAEGGSNASEGLVIENNTARFVPGLARNTHFVASWTGERFTIRNNDLARGIVRFDQR
ncbi:right-handed parallel beta-helix repeat-containing protein [Blastomonas marina]|uniref:right-handed parallel beta-helix repeat-containing protein n=1 Tax=Blastomonas marina TaxID=1867408 RepID=UPI002AC9AA2D|nr:right-handed parallel beta-helix repeat-containing protein [Blastomonas marina]WPZ03648.1 right-handed parallel beta-helix repeat-containing protein [Blastomonas marina]